VNKIERFVTLAPPPAATGGRHSCAAMPRAALLFSLFFSLVLSLLLMG